MLHFSRVQGASPPLCTKPVVAFQFEISGQIVSITLVVGKSPTVKTVRFLNLSPAGPVRGRPLPPPRHRLRCPVLCPLLPPPPRNALRTQQHAQEQQWAKELAEAQASAAAREAQLKQQLAEQGGGGGGTGVGVGQIGLAAPPLDVHAWETSAQLSQVSFSRQPGLILLFGGEK